MRVVKSNFIPDRSRPGKTTTITSDWAPRVTSGHATWMQRRGGKQWRRRKERNEERKKAKKIKLRVATLNVGTMTGKGREVADLMERRGVDILCVQETRWKGERARCIGGGYKMWYCGSGNKKNGVGIILKKEHVDRVAELWRVSERIICLKMELDGVMLNVISAYAPQVGCIREEKETFWLDLDETVEKIPRNERIVVGTDLNGHVGKGNNGDEECMGRHGLRKRNNEGQAVVDFAKRRELAITNTYFVKKPAHRVTYSSGGRSSQVDYIMVRRQRIKEVVDTKVVVGKSVAKQHRIVVSAIIIWTKWRKAPKLVKRIKWWKLKDSKVNSKFKMDVIESGILSGQEDWQTIAEMIRSIARKELGETSGKVSTEGRQETWWWNQEVQEKLKEKKKAKKAWDTIRDDASKLAYKTAIKQAKKEVAKARNKAYEELYEKLETKEGENEVFKIAKQKNRQSKDVQQIRVIKSKTGEILMEEEKVKQRWKEYFDNLLNHENPRERRETRTEERERDVEDISGEEVRTGLRRMKKGKAQGPDDIPVEAWIALGNKGVEFLVKFFNRLLRGEKMPDEWRRSVLVPLYKGKGDIKECRNYRGIKLMSHTMKLWERIIEARIRKEVTIAEQQFGFMPGRSTTDAIFCLRMLLEKWTEGQKAVHCAFIDLEKAYDRVPREELWECLRLAETSECYIRIIQDMYDGATTTVRSAAGLTEEFKVGVGLHQGSALSPFLFVIIMDRLTEDIRKDAPWDMLFADDIVLCRKNHRELEEDLEIWRNALERRGLKVSRSKTEYLRVGGVDDGEELKLQEEEVKKAKNFKYLGSTVSNDGRCEEEVRTRIQAGWMSWRKVSGVLCDRKLSAKVKGKIYKSVVRPAMLYGMETVAVTEQQMRKMKVAELKMVRSALGVTRKDKIRNEYVRGTAKIAKLGEKLRNVRLRWYGHVKRREKDYVGKRMMEMAVPGRRKRGRPRRRWMDLVREDMERVGAREGDEVDRVKWRLLSRCGDPE